MWSWVVILSQQDIELEGDLPVILRKLTIRGGCGLDSKCKLDGRGVYKLLVVGASDRVRGSLRVEMLHLTNAYIYDKFSMDVRGAALQVRGNATVEVMQCIFSQNHAAGNLAAGGALDVREDGAAYVTDSHFTDNHADKAGGAVVAAGVVEVRDGCTFNGNFQGTNFKVLAIKCFISARSSYRCERRLASETVCYAGGQRHLRRAGACCDSCHDFAPTTCGI
jgi:hypothetical protein